jgi:hypothetical protein
VISMLFCLAVVIVDRFSIGDVHLSVIVRTIVKVKLFSD